MVVARALSLTESLPEPQRGAQFQAIFAVLHPRMVAFFQERLAMMDPARIPEGPVTRFFKDEGRREGLILALRSTLLRQIERRGLSLDDAQRARIEAETSPRVLELWLDRVLDAADTDAVLGPA